MTAREHTRVRPAKIGRPIRRIWWQAALALLATTALGAAIYLRLSAAAPTSVDRLIDFQHYQYGVPPEEFDYSATGPHTPVLAAGRPLWRTYVDNFAPSPKFVL